MRVRWRAGERTRGAGADGRAFVFVLAFVLQEHFRAWLADPNGRDQMVLYRGDDVQVVWNTKTAAPEVAHERSVRSLSSRLASRSPANTATRARRNGPSPTPNGRLKVPSWRRSTAPESPSGEVPHSSASTGSPTPRSSSSTSPPSSGTSSPGLLAPSRSRTTRAECRPSRTRTRGTRSPFGTS